MKRPRKSCVFRSIRLGVILVLVVFAGPSLIHLGYRVVTPLATQRANAERYHSLANAEVSGGIHSEEDGKRLRAERRNLFYWFHARGWSIDEGDEKTPWFHPWRELIRHWAGERSPG